MNIYATISLITALVGFSLAIFVLKKCKKLEEGKIFALVTMLTSTWTLCPISAALLPHTGPILLIRIRLLYLAVAFIPTVFLHLMLTVVNRQDIRSERRILRICYFISTLFAVNVFSPNFIKALTFDTPFFSLSPGYIYNLFFLFFAIIGIYGALKPIIAFTRTTEAYTKMRLRYFSLQGIAGISSGLLHFSAVYLKYEPFPHDILVIIYFSIAAYAIVKHRLMDIRVAITRTGIFVAVYTLVLGLPFWLGYKYHLWHYSTLLMAILATIGPFIYMQLEKRSKELIYKIEFKRYETLRKFSKTLLLIKELDKLVELIVYRLVKTLKVSYAGIYLYDKEKDAYELKSYRPLKYPNAPRGETLTKKDSLIKLLFIWRKELIREEVANLPLGKKYGGSHDIDLGLVQYKMRELSATLVIPHFVENDLLGFLVLGDKEKNAIYTEEDISILSSLSNSAALSIENALFLIDLKITQAELFNTKRIAELGYMASAMGHEINNRLQAIYSAGLDMIDNPVIYDSIKNNPQAKENFDKDIKHINENIEDATAIINELKTYARPQDNIKQNLEPLNLKDVIDKALRVVKLQSVKAFDIIDLAVNIPDTLSKTSGNFIQLQQVFVNLLNNAHDAILEKKNYASAHPEANLTGYKGKIQIKIEEVKNLLDIHVIDNGIGMTEEIKKRLFIPLYTSKATAERKAQRGIKGGTGIGLYTIQTIIRGHNGAISVYDTQWLQGTDFLMTLPVTKEKK